MRSTRRFALLALLCALPYAAACSAEGNAGENPPVDGAAGDMGGGGDSGTEGEDTGEAPDGETPDGETPEDSGSSVGVTAALVAQTPGGP